MTRPRTGQRNVGMVPAVVTGFVSAGAGLSAAGVMLRAEATGGAAAATFCCGGAIAGCCCATGATGAGLAACCARTPGMVR